MSQILKIVHTRPILHYCETSDIDYFWNLWANEKAKMQYPKLRVDLFALMQLLIFSFHLKKLVKVHVDQNRVHTVHVICYTLLHEIFTRHLFCDCKVRLFAALKFCFRITPLHEKMRMKCKRPWTGQTGKITRDRLLQNKFIFCYLQCCILCL